ncbi:polysaccharide deacetylase family protein [Ningiella sp. W23]|uniref:polysaccharide deacetylase family protein n=1 Tax=Ningiella sp. W23 TaxID=3023715 RepID=UPI003756B2F3
MRLWITAILCVLLISEIGELRAKQIALTFDDSPRQANGVLSGSERASMLVAALERNNVEQVAFFSVSQRLDAEGQNRLKTYSDAGHIIANHTHSHPDINKTSEDAFIAEIKLASKLLGQYPTYKNWFRFPYLREGGELEKRNGVRQFLKTNKMLNAYITINNYDWYIENQFQNAAEQGIVLNDNAMKNYYVDIIMEAVEYYDQLAIKHLGRSPKHVLLLHETDISALYIDDLIQRLRQNNWKIITIEDAYEDDISEFEISSPLKFNPGRIGEIALSEGQTKNLWHSSLEESYLNNEFKRRVLSVSE